MHKSSKPAASPSAHFRGEQTKKHCFTYIDLSYDSNLIMAALFMDLLIALTCRWLILFKTMLFICAWMLTELLPHPVYAWKQICPPVYFRQKKLSLQYCLKLTCNYNNPAYTAFSILISTLYLKENLLNYLLLQSLLQVISKRLVSKRVMLLHLLYQPHHLGF